jgi:hypothetical protein
MKDLEDINQQINSLVRALSRGKMPESTTLTSLDELLVQSKRLTSAVEKSKLAMRGDDSWQRGLD